MSEAISLAERVRGVHALRTLLTHNKQTLADYQRFFNDDNAVLIAAIAEQSKVLAQAEAELRHATILHYQDTGDKTPGYGLGLRMVRRVRYLEHKALEWAREHKLFLIPESLDVKAFEKHCKDSKTPPAFVEVFSATEATIPADLGKVLAEQPEPAGEDIPCEVTKP